MTEFPEIIKDGDLELRLVEATFDNARAIYDIVDRNRGYFGEFLGWVAKMHSPEDEFAWVADAAKDKRDYQIFVDGIAAGTIGFPKYFPDENKRWLEIGYWIDSAFAGRGIMTRSVGLLESVVFKGGEFDRIQILVDENNTASRRVAEKSGYKLEGTLRSYDRMGTKSSGDIRVYSKLKSEWLAGNKN